MVNAVVTMSEFLELPDWEGTDVIEGSPIPDDQSPPVRTVEPLPEGQNPPAVEGLMKIAERANDEVVKAREKKERENRLRAEGKRKAGEGTSNAAPRKRNRGTNSVGIIPSLGATLDASPIHLAPPNSAPQNPPANAEQPVNAVSEREGAEGGGNSYIQANISPNRVVVAEQPRTSGPRASDGNHALF